MLIRTEESEKGRMESEGMWRWPHQITHNVEMAWTGMGHFRTANCFRLLPRVHAVGTCGCDCTAREQGCVLTHSEVGVHGRPSSSDHFLSQHS